MVRKIQENKSPGPLFPVGNFCITAHTPEPLRDQAEARLWAETAFQLNLLFQSYPAFLTFLQFPPILSKSCT